MDSLIDLRASSTRIQPFLKKRIFCYLDSCGRGPKTTLVSCDPDSVSIDLDSCRRGLRLWTCSACFKRKRHRFNHGQKSLGQYCIIHTFLSFLGSLIKQCILLEIFLHFLFPPPPPPPTLHKVETWKRILDKRLTLLDACIQ